MSRRAMNWFMLLGSLTLGTIFCAVTLSVTAYAHDAPASRQALVAVAPAKVAAEAKVAKLPISSSVPVVALVPASQALAPVQATPRAPAVVAPVKPDDPQGAAEVVRGAMHTSNWRLVVLAGLLLTVLILRRAGGWFLPGRAGAWVQSDRGGATLALAAGVLTVTVNGLIAGGRFDPQLLVDGVLASATTAGSFSIAKKLTKPSDLQATPAGPNAPQS